VVQQPNFLGVIEDLSALASAAHAGEALLVVMQNPMTLGVLAAPGCLGADIVVGDVQVFGNAMCFGGPSAGFLACRQAYLRQVPVDWWARPWMPTAAGATRSPCRPGNNISAGQGHLEHLLQPGPQRPGGDGVSLSSRTSRAQGARRAMRPSRSPPASRLCSLPGVRPVAEGPFFHEFAIHLPMADTEFTRAMRAFGVDPGVPLSRFGRPNSLLVAVTELNPPEALDRYVATAHHVLETDEEGA